jgi:hypothetical protein
MDTFDKRSHSPDPPTAGGGGAGKDETNTPKLRLVSSEPSDWFVRGDQRVSLENLTRLCQEDAERDLQSEAKFVSCPEEIWRSVKLLENFLGYAKARLLQLGGPQARKLTCFGADSSQDNPLELRVRELFKTLETVGMQHEVLLDMELQKTGLSSGEARKLRNKAKEDREEMLRLLQSKLLSFVTEARFCALATTPPFGNPAVVESIQSKDVSASTPVGDIMARIFQDAAASHSHRERLIELPRVYKRLLEVLPGPEFRLLVIGGGGAGFDLASLIQAFDDDAANGRLFPERSASAAMLKRLRLGVLDTLPENVDRSEARIKAALGSMQSASRLFEGPSVFCGEWKKEDFGTFLGEYRGDTWPNRILSESEVIVIPGWAEYFQDRYMLSLLRGALHAAKLVMFTTLTPEDPDKFVRKRLLGWNTIERGIEDTAALIESVRCSPSDTGAPFGFKARRREDINTVEDLLAATCGQGLEQLKGGDYFSVKIGAVNLLHGLIRDDYPGPG